MKTASKRLAALASYAFNPTIVLLLGVFVFSYMVPKSLPESSLKIIEYKSHGRSQVVFFEPKIDLSSQLHFNLKQIFVYVRAVYGGRSDRAEIIWSRIFERQSEKKELTKVFRSTYEVVGNLTDDPTFELRGCYTPYVGIVEDVLFCKTEVKI
ncbi:hypothetical protein M896_100440 [Ordospora colligata OC4]|uniref:Signal peptidase n=1 Tax=Ordospora colligata OC4 TaxID=1354746 RepID=A0A0B2UJ98_9MICR|nr:uncharacterized protein M896_100440 [Ordospora colligata OC4]KHN69060.1 hypothetical protein M896_100440 [Ordospora colligata OC4]